MVHKVFMGSSKKGVSETELFNIHNIDEFKREYVKQGGKILKSSGKDWLVVQDKKGKKINMMILRGKDKITLFPFNFGD